MKHDVKMLKTTGNRELYDRVKEATSHIDILELIAPDRLHIGRDTYTLAEAKAAWTAAAKEGHFHEVSFSYDFDRLAQYEHYYDGLGVLQLEIRAALRKTQDPVSHFQLVNYLNAVSNQLRAIEVAFLIPQARGNADRVNRSNERFLKQIYGSPSARAIHEATVMAKKPAANRRHLTKIPSKVRQRLAETKVSSQDLAQMFREAMEYYSGRIGHDVSYRVVLSPKSTSCCVYPRFSDGQPRIIIPDHKIYSAQRALELVAHEVCIHWLDHVIGAEYGLLKEGDDTMAEGHALLNEAHTHQRYAGEAYVPKPYYVYAMTMANRGATFAEIGKTLMKTCGTDADTAFTSAYRVLRGSVGQLNPSNYSFTKDRAYFEGYLFARQIVREHKAGYLDFSVLSRAHFDDFMEVFEVPRPLASRSLLIDQLALRFI